MSLSFHSGIPSQTVTAGSAVVLLANVTFRMILVATFCLNIEHPGTVLAINASSSSPPSEAETLSKA